MKAVEKVTIDKSVNLSPEKKREYEEIIKKRLNERSDEIIRDMINTTVILSTSTD